MTATVAGLPTAGRPTETARRARSRPSTGCADYMRRTSGFVPLPPRSR